jgi:histidinol phosphatase-like PHP family hydrolase
MELSELSREELEQLVADKSRENEELIEKNKSLQQELDGTLEINAKLSSIIEEQPAAAPQKKDLSKVTLSTSIFEVDGVKKTFALAKITHKGLVITADDVLASESLAKELVAMGSGMIKNAE